MMFEDHSVCFRLYIRVHLLGLLLVFLGAFGLFLYRFGVWQTNIVGNGYCKQLLARQLTVSRKRGG